MSSVGSAAETLSERYGTSLGVIGLLTTALILSHFLVQLPAGRAIDARGAWNVGMIAAALCVGGNLLALAAPTAEVALFARLVTGLGSGAGFVAGADLMRVARPTPVLQGVYGASTLLGGGLAVAIVPQLVSPLGWTAPYITGALVGLATALAVWACHVEIARRPRGPRFLVDRRLLPLGAIHAATLGVGFVTANWVVVLLTRGGLARPQAALVGALVLLGGILTRPIGGIVAARNPRLARKLTALSLLGLGASTAALALPLPTAAFVAVAACAGACAGFPFATVFGSTQRLVPDAPAAALAFVNALGILVILLGAPLAGLAFDATGSGRIAFVALGAAATLALFALPRAELIGRRD